MKAHIGMRAGLSVAAASIALTAAAVAAAERAPQHPAPDRTPAAHRASTSADDWIRALHVRSEALNERYGLGKP